MARGLSYMSLAVSYTHLYVYKRQFYDCVKYLSEFFNIVIFSKETDDFINGEIILKNCTKGDAMKRAVAYLGGDMKDTIAFGDSMNDFQMISEAAYGVVSYLAPDKLKAIAAVSYTHLDVYKRQGANRDGNWSDCKSVSE